MYPPPDVLARLIQQIVAAVHPLRIVVFGSAARGDMHPDSDIDLLVVMPEGVHRRRTARDLYRRLRGIGLPFDVIVATPADLDRHKDNPGLIYQTILREGRDIYVA